MVSRGREARSSKEIRRDYLPAMRSKENKEKMVDDGFKEKIID